MSNVFISTLFPLNDNSPISLKAKLINSKSFILNLRSSLPEVVELIFTFPSMSTEVNIFFKFPLNASLIGCSCLGSSLIF